MRVLWISCLLIGSITCYPVPEGYSSSDSVSADSWYRHVNYEDDSPVHKPTSHSVGFTSDQVSIDQDTVGEHVYSRGDDDFSYHISQHVSPTSIQDGEYHGGMAQGDYGFDGGYFVPEEESESVSYFYGQKADYNPPQASGYKLTDSTAQIGSYAYSGSDDYDEDEDDFEPLYLNIQEEGYDGDAGFEGKASEVELMSEEGPEEVFSDVSDLQPVYASTTRSRYQRGRKVFSQISYTPGEVGAPSEPTYKASSKTVFAPKHVDHPSKAKGF